MQFFFWPDRWEEEITFFTFQLLCSFFTRAVPWMLLWDVAWQGFILYPVFVSVHLSCDDSVVAPDNGLFLFQRLDTDTDLKHSVFTGPWEPVSFSHWKELCFPSLFFLLSIVCSLHQSCHRNVAVTCFISCLQVNLSDLSAPLWRSCNCQKETPWRLVRTRSLHENW